MEQSQSFFQNIRDAIKASLFLKLSVIFILSLLLLIPTDMVQDLIVERMSYRNEVIKDVTSSWGGSQMVTGPFLSIPYRIPKTDKEGKVTYYQNTVHITPEDLNINGTIVPEIRQKSIYEVMLYTTQIRIDGNFKLPELSELNVETAEYLLDQAYVSMGISDQSGIQKKIELQWDKEASPREFEPGTPNKDILESGFHSLIALSPDQNSYTYSFAVDVRGFKSLTFLPVGKNTSTQVSSSWEHPGYIGNFAPSSKSKETGFQGEWNIFHLSRNIPSWWIGQRTWDVESWFGVELIQLVDEYQKNMRTVKYAFLIICLTFLAFFLMETIRKNRIHPFQYIMAGFTLVVFYVLLVSLSEHIGFDWGYLISAVLTVGLIIVYISAVLRNRQMTGLLGGLLTVIYGFIYVILQLENFALLVGALGIFIALAVTMIVTRKIDWYGLRS